MYFLSFFVPFFYWFPFFSLGTTTYFYTIVLTTSSFSLIVVLLLSISGLRVPWWGSGRLTEVVSRLYLSRLRKRQRTYLSIKNVMRDTITTILKVSLTVSRKLEDGYISDYFTGLVTEYLTMWLGLRGCLYFKPR